MRDEPAPLDDRRPMHEPGTTDYEQGRRDEAAEESGRFARGRETEPERTDEPATGTPRRDY